MSSGSLLYTLSLNDWERITFHTVASETTFLGPPVPLHALSLVCRHIHNSVSVRNNSRLYARIFRLKFDYAAPARRLTERWLTSRCLAKELISRFSALQRIRRKREYRQDDLWTAYLMMSESDGKNESQLLDWAGLRGYLDMLVANRLYHRVPWNSDLTSTSLLVWLLWMTISRNGILQEQLGTNDAMLMFLRPFVAAGYRVPSVYGPDSFFNLPLCEEVTNTPSHSSGPSPPYAEIIYFSHKLVLAVPTVTSAATLLTAVRNEALQTSHTFPANAYTLPADRATANALNVGGPTLEDVARFHFQERIHAPSRCTPIIDVIFYHDDDIDEADGEEALSPSHGSQRYEEDWSRLVNCYDPWAIPSPLRGKVYTVGSLAGSWEGRLMLPDFEAHISALLDPRRSSSVSIQHKPLYWTLQEHHCLHPNTPLYAAMGNLGDDDFLNAWLPRKISVRSLEDAIEVFDSGTGLNARYETFVPNSEAPYPSSACTKLEKPWISDTIDPGNEYASQEGTSVRLSRDSSTSYIDDDDEYEDVVSQKSSGVCDILFTGETDEQHGDAWGHFKIIGRARPWDGLIVLLRSPRNPEQAELGEWVFKGYLHDQNLVGRWREKYTPVDMIGFEGAFVALTRPSWISADSPGHILELVSSTDLKSAEFVGEGDSSTIPEIYFSSLVETVVSVAPDARASTYREP